MARSVCLSHDLAVTVYKLLNIGPNARPPRSGNREPLLDKGAASPYDKIGTKVRQNRGQVNARLDDDRGCGTDQ
jgi:hypothetical protein